MARLGISLYPEHATLEQNKNYIDLASQYGFQRIFTCLLSVEQPREVVMAEFKEIIEYAHDHDMEVILDVAPSVFERLQISYEDLSFFHELQADGIRLDEGFDSLKEALMTHNPYGLKIEINASVTNRYLENIMSHYPDKNKLITCHNFYPQRYTGLGYKRFMENSLAIKEMNLPVAAFISSQVPGSFGPWPVNDGLCTLEMHRDLPVSVAARHLFATGVVDDVIISNCFASEEEMKVLSKIDPGTLTFTLEEEIELSDVEAKIVYEHTHYARGDMSDYMARSTIPRLTFAKESIPARNTRDLKRGDVVIVNDTYGRYKGELHVVLQDMPNDGKKNVVGHIPENERMLLDYLDPWKVFAFMK